jgi:4'-phosphopantetheinyl transferase
VSGDSSGNDTVDVWWFDLDVDRDAVTACAALLGPEESRRVASLATAELRRQMTVRIARRRTVLAEVLGVTAERLDLRREASGRPYVVAPDGSRRSVSTSSRGDVAVVASSPDHVVGVDVEATSELGSAPRLVERIASVAERIVLENLDQTQRDDAVLRLWTRKEALLKATGEGIGGGLAHLTVPLGAELAAPFQPHGRGAWWRCYDLAVPRKGLAAALVVSARGVDEPPVDVRVTAR